MRSWARGRDAAAHEQLFRQFPLAISTGSHEVPQAVFYARDAPQLLVCMA